MQLVTRIVDTDEKSTPRGYWNKEPWDNLVMSALLP